LGSALVDTKTNEIPVARQLFPKLDLEGRFVSLDALHTQTETALDLVQEHGAHYTLTVKDNQPRLHETIKKLLPEIPAAFPP
jgi:predicted transposase YbfD/YdcC